MLRPRFEALALRYGCHDREWSIPQLDRPVVITGRNGSGKTTLVEGLVRTLFGFDRRKTDDAEELEARRPWEAEGMRGRVVVASNGDRFDIRRDFSSDQVRILALEEGTEQFRGDGNPAARNQEARHFRRILTDLLGLRELEAYRQTLLIRQGELPTATLGDHLLRIAAGGHTRVETARREIAEAHRSITRRPLHPAAAAAINPRELEKLDDEIAAVQARLEEAQAAGERRAPLALDRERTAERLATLDQEIELLENALPALARTDAAELQTRRLRQHMEGLEHAAHELEAAAEELDASRAAREETLEGGAYPEDFPERLARAEVRWSDIDELRRPPAPWLGIAAVVVLAGAGALLAYGLTPWAAVAAGAGVLAGTVWGAVAVLERRRRRAALGQIGGLLEGVPHAEALSPETSRQTMGRYRAQRDAGDRVRRARDDLADALRLTRSALRDAGGAPSAGEGDGGAGAGLPPARRLLARVRAAADASRDRLAHGRVELDRIGDLSLSLPDDVAPTEEAVAEALRQRRAERTSAQESLRDVSQELLERGTPGESAEALEALLESLVSRREALTRKAGVLEAAHALLLDAYDAFRDTDQERLTGLVSGHVKRLGGGILEGIVVDGTLDEARVRTRDRVVPLATPPLSFGEFHALQLGVRLGAADFLAGVGILPPLIVDEPFAHLDADRAAAVWTLLEEVARSRQVVVTTQDERLLDGLGVEPHICLEP